MDTSLTGLGQRIYEVRSALGPDARHEMPQRAFAELLNRTAATLYPDEATRPNYDSSVIARLERGERPRVTVADITVIAAVDPDRRGKLWLGWNEAPLVGRRSIPRPYDEGEDEDASGGRGRAGGE